MENQMETSHRIRPMEEKDLEETAALEESCFTESWSLKMLSEGLKSKWDTWLVWEEDGRIQGYCVLRVLAGEGEIQRIASRPTRRRQGIGRGLMEAMIMAARDQGAGAISLEVRESNQAARKLYESYGFSQEAVRRDYYHNPREDALILWNRKI